MAAIAPAVVVVLFAFRGWVNIDHAMLLGGVALFTFAPAYLFADFLLSFFGRGAPEPTTPSRGSGVE